MQNTVIYLIGFPGIGKLTVAKQLSIRINARIVDNHLINNPIFQLITIDNTTPIPEMAWYRVGQIREVVLGAIEDLAAQDLNFIFTNELLASSEHDINVYKQIEQVARKRNSLLVPVRLMCDVDELCKRVTSPGRAEKFKLTSSEAIRQKVTKEQLYEPEHLHTQTIDVTHLTPEQVVDKIIAATIELKDRA